jgi:uncharacterized metal-binding protein
MSDSGKRFFSACAKCSGSVCYPMIRAGDPAPPVDEAPLYCPMRRMPDVMKRTAREYRRTDIREFARLASIQEAQCYEITADGIRTRFPRLEETMQFAVKCNYRRIGLAFCVGLREEARMVTEILTAKGFEVVSVNCKVGGVPKESIGIKSDEKIMGPELAETMCNPITQAEVLNAEGVDLAIVLGLCVGHDTLFFKYILVPCTVLAVKDRVLGHNPLAAAYLSKAPYYGRLRTPAVEKSEGEKATLPEDVRKREPEA